ncbi:sarcosine oxidase subunit gamma [Pararhizobium sp.]|uniref:sarcosine oxidase subunit gamma n=1 Tax=Pararhizobium sp. TaxID=1977563 RepID=UPI002716ADC7|nr:sarcosine oxidase subunit gamma family protein [Pararhizobium sp.]MDO9415034.1 sarcosine oxidase subunit gamma family protein [Pararhizobium sp.]
MAHRYADRHALDGLIPASSGRRAADHLEIVYRVSVAVVLSVPGHEIDAATLLVSESEVSVRIAGPGEWLAVSLELTPDGLRAALSADLGDAAHIIDQSHGRALLRLSGPNARRILAKGVGVDLALEAFSEGHSANVLCGHIATNLACVGPDTFELLVMRSFAESLYEDLKLMGRAHGLSVAFSA